MPWRPLPRIAFAVAIYPFQPAAPSDLPLELGDELYIIEQGGKDGSWYRGYLVAPPCLLAGLTSVKGQTLEARVFSGIFPTCCVEVREELGEGEGEWKGHGRASDGRSHPTTYAGHIQHMAERAEPEAAPGSWRSARADPHKSLEVTPTRRPDSSRDRRLQQSGTDNTQRSSYIPAAADYYPAHPSPPAKPPAPVPMLKIGDETPTSEREPLVDEIASGLREWYSRNLHELLLNRQYGLLDKMTTIVAELDLARRQLLHSVLTSAERDLIRDQSTWNLVKGNKMLSGEVIVRDPAQRGYLLTRHNSAMEMTKLQSVMSLLDSAHIAHPEGPALHHLLLEIKAINGGDLDSVKITVGLFRYAEDGTFSPLSETFALYIPSSDSLANMARSSKLKTLFTDLTAADIGDLGQARGQKIYLVIKVQDNQAPRMRSTMRSRSAIHEAPTSSAGGGDSSSSSNNNNNNNSNNNNINNSDAGPLTDAQKGGRRSLMFGAKKNRTGLKEAINTSSDGRLTPHAEEPSETPSRAGGSTSALMRTIGAGMLDVGAILRQGEDVEQIVTIWSPASVDDHEDESRSTFDKNIANILPSPTGRYVRARKASRIHLALSPFVASDADTLMRTNSTSMHMVTQTQKIGFSEAPKKPRSDIYLTLSEANIPRDAVLSHPESGLTPVPAASSMRNLQLTMEVRDGSGKHIDQSIYPSSNSPGVKAWRTTATDRGTAWSQTICLRIDKEHVPGSHLIMSVADAPEFPFALSWMPLWNKQAFLKDGHHSLLMHAYDDTTVTMVDGRAPYLSLAWDASEKNLIAQDESVTGPLATLVVESYLCSTEYSQDQVILGLINWRQQTSDQLMDLLRKIVFVPEIEIVKQLSDVFDALFGIVVCKSGEAEYEDLVFTDLVAVLAIVHDRRFNLGPLVDQYAKHRFDFPFSTSCLIRSYTRLLENATAPEQARHLRAAFKVGQHILQFIIVAREQQKVKEEGIGITGIHKNFAREMQSIFRALENLMRNPAPLLVGSKTLVVQHFHTWLPELLAAFSSAEVVDLATRFINACQDVKGKLILYKLILILNFAQLDHLFPTQEARATLIDHTISWLEPYWGATAHPTEQWRDQVRLCASVVAEQLRQPSAQFYDFMPKIVASFCSIVQRQEMVEKSHLSFLFSKTYPFTAKQVTSKQVFDEPLLELAALISSIAKIPPPPSIRVPDEELSAYVRSILDTLNSVLDCKAYPASWLSLHIYHHRSAMHVLEFIYSLLARSFLPPPELAETFAMELWRYFFMTLLKLVGSDALALETFPEQKRRAVWKIAGDVREQGADLLRRCWEAIGWETNSDDLRRYGLHRLGGYQVQYVPSLVCPIMELCLSVHEGLRRVAVDVLRTMIVSEWALSEDLGLIETEMIASLDLIFKSKTINESITQKMFITELLDLFEPIASQPDDALWNALRELVHYIDELMDLLVAAHGDSIESSLHTLTLMEFMKDMQKEDIFIRYVHELARMQDEARNPTESGLALQSHADLYAWDPNKTVAAIGSPFFVEQNSFERREALYFQMIEQYEEGKAWSLALGCYRELAYHYEHTTFDLSKLARAQRSMAKINETIVTQVKQYPRYFRVHYHGLGFPSSDRDKQYIFEGSPNERMATFTDRMQKQYPSASVTQSAPNENAEGQHLQISTVSPFRDLGHAVYVRSKVPVSIREHLLISEAHQFSVTSKRHAPGTSVTEQSVDKTVYTTFEPFPNLLRKSEILTTEDLRLTPLQTAVERIWRKTVDLVGLEKRALAGEDPALRGLTDGLSRLLDLESSVGGTCLAQYRVFLEVSKREEEAEAAKGDDLVVVDDDDEDDDDDGHDQDEGPGRRRDPLLLALEIALSDHAAAIRRCLALYTRPSLQATRKELARLFEHAYPEEANPSAPPSRSHNHPPRTDSPSSTTRSHAEATVRLGPTISPQRPESAMMSQLSSDIVNQLRDANHPRAGSPTLDPGVGGRRSRDRSQHQRLSLSLFKNAKGTLAPEQTPDPGAASPRMIAELDGQSRSDSLGGGWIHVDPNGGLATRPNGSVHDSPSAESLPGYHPSPTPATQNNHHHHHDHHHNHNHHLLPLDPTSSTTTVTTTTATTSSSEYNEDETDMDTFGKSLTKSLGANITAAGLTQPGESGTATADFANTDQDSHRRHEARSATTNPKSSSHRDNHGRNSNGNSIRTINLHNHNTSTTVGMVRLGPGLGGGGAGGIGGKRSSLLSKWPRRVNSSGPGPGSGLVPASGRHAGAGVATGSGSRSGSVSVSGSRAGSVRSFGTGTGIGAGGGTGTADVGGAAVGAAAGAATGGGGGGRKSGSGRFGGGSASSSVKRRDKDR